MNPFAFDLVTKPDYERHYKSMMNAVKKTGPVEIAEWENVRSRLVKCLSKFGRYDKVGDCSSGDFSVQEDWFKVRRISFSFYYDNMLRRKMFSAVRKLASEEQIPFAIESLWEGRTAAPCSTLYFQSIIYRKKAFLTRHPFCLCDYKAFACHVIASKRLAPLLRLEMGRGQP